MSNHNRFLLPHSSASNSGATSSSSAKNNNSENNPEDRENQLSVDDDFDSYWDDEARNPNRNRIRIGRQYQATVPPLLDAGESDQRKLSELETLTFCPKKSAKVSDAEFDHYFLVAKSLNLFASLVETRSLLGRDVTIADLNHIRNKEGLSLASVIQPTRQAPQPSQISGSTSRLSPVKSPPSMSQSQDHKPTSSTSASSPSDSTSLTTNVENFAPNQALMSALSHFISLHHPCHHDQDCKKLNKQMSIDDEQTPTVSITAGNLRQITSTPNGSLKVRSRAASKHNQTVTLTKTNDDATSESNSNLDQEQAISDTAFQSASYEDWTREEIELFSKAIEVCGKNFGSIKKEFLPTKSVRSIVEYYYIGSRDVPDGKKRSSQNLESGECCNISDKSQPNNSRGNGSSEGARDFVAPSSSSSSLINKTSSATSSTRSIVESDHESRGADRGFSDYAKSLTTASQKANSQVKTKLECTTPPARVPDLVKSKANPKNIDARMSVYNFDEEFVDESPVKVECPPRPGAEVKPLRAKPIVPNAASDNEAGNSNVGSLKFFMDGQLVLKLNACQDQQEGAEKCHWVQSGERALTQNRQKRYTKRLNSESARAPSEQSLNGSHSNSVLSSNLDEDSKIDDFTMDEDSKESANSFSNPLTPQRPRKHPTPKRPKASKAIEAASTTSGNNASSPIDYNRLALNNRMKDRVDSINSQSPIPAASPLLNQVAAGAVAMPNWLQANQFAMAAAILGGLPFPAAAAAAAGNMMQNINNNIGHSSQNNGANHMPTSADNNNGLNLATSEPMDLSLEYGAPKPILSKPSGRSRSKQKN